MKPQGKYQIAFTTFLLIISILLNAQVDERVRSLVTKNDGTEYSGYIIQEDAREILIRTDNVGEIYIPKHEIRSIRELKDAELISGKYRGSKAIASRYFLSANALPLKKGDSYAMIQLPGAEYQVAVINNLTIGGMSSWIGVPIVATARYSVRVIDNISVGAGIMAGTGSWASLGSYGLLPYGAITIGNQRINLNFSGGFLKLNISEGEDPGTWSDLLISVGAYARLGERVSFVGDSFIYAKDGVVAVLVPGLRFDRNKGGAFQFGLGGLIVDGEVVPFPVPMLSWLIDI